MIKYLGSKRTMVPHILALVERLPDVRQVCDLFTGTTRVAQALKDAGYVVTANDLATYSYVMAQAFIEADADELDLPWLDTWIEHLNALPGIPGYVTHTFCEESRFFHPKNGARIDAIRDEIAREWSGSPLEPILLTSLIEAADRVDSTTGVQMAYVKQWAPRSARPLELRVPELLAGSGRAVLGDAVALAPELPGVDLAYLDPPYNQHRYRANYHGWETLVAWDAPAHYGVACKRADLRDRSTASAFNSRPAMPGALRAVIDGLDAGLLVVSCSNEGWVDVDELAAWCGERHPAVDVVGFGSRRYVGAQIGVYNPEGERVGEVSHLDNTEYLVLAGRRAAVRAAAQASRDATSASTSASGGASGRGSRRPAPTTSSRRTGSPSPSIVATTTSVRNRLR